LQIRPRKRAAERRRGSDDKILVRGTGADAERPRRATRHHARLLVRRLHAVVRLACLVEECPTQFGESNGARTAVEQRSADLSLQPAYRLADGGLREMQAPRCAPEVQFIGNGDETFDLAQIQYGSHPKRRGQPDVTISGWLAT
jgi:hypothetical protein